MRKLLFFLLITLFGCTKSSGQKVQSKAYDVMLKSLLDHTIQEISVEAVNKKNNVVYLDTRSKEEYDVSRIKDAVWVGYDEFDKSKLNDISKDKTIVLYCSVGYRSEKIGEKLEALGYKNVYNLYGGIFEWVNQGHAVYNDQGKTNDIHPYDDSWGMWLTKGNKTYK